MNADHNCRDYNCSREDEHPCCGGTCVQCAALKQSPTTNGAKPLVINLDNPDRPLLVINGEWAVELMRFQK